jgi:transcription elongation factor GreB
MSRGFVREEDQEEIPIVPPRADLPAGITNYVTPIGMGNLLQEKQDLIDERENLALTSENEKRIASNYINAKLNLLNDRINTAKVVDLSKQKQDEVLFGALITLKIGKENKPQKYQIVGVDEANISKKKISFVSPIAKLLLTKKVGEKALLKLPKEDRVFEILAISYPESR